MLGLTALARRLLVPYPILLVLGGLALGFVPGLTPIVLAPDLVFLVFLPPILWAAAYFTSFRDLQRNIRPISLLAFGLVFTTTFAVAAVARLIMPDLGWAPALALGAIVSPPDAVAATAIGRRLAIPRRVVAILEGESLINDASALVIYRAAVGATVTGVFLLGDALTQFVFATVAGVAIGLAVGFLAGRAMAALEDSFIEIAITLLAPYIAWVVAEGVHASAVLACVAGGLYIRRQYSAIAAPTTRIQARAVWDQLVFLLNGFIFILIGLQLGVLRHALTPERNTTILWWAALVSLTVILVRLAWVPLGTAIPRILSKSIRDRDPIPPPKNVFLVAWIGMRGIVSLAAALALPLETSAGTPFPYRNELILITFGVILATLVLQGLSLAPLVKWLGFEPEEDVKVEEMEARERASKAALERLQQLKEESWVHSGHLDRLHVYYNERQRRSSQIGAGGGDGSAAEAAAYRRLRHSTLTAERLALVELRNQGEIGDETLHQLEHELDVEALRIGIGELR